MTRQEKPDTILSLTKKDFKIEYYKASSGHGGQKVNKTANAVRISHHNSGAVGKSNTHRSRHQNQIEAFRRLTNSKKFKSWLKMEVAARIAGYRNIEEKVEEIMNPENLEIEVFQEGKWRKENDQ